MFLTNKIQIITHINTDDNIRLYNLYFQIRLRSLYEDKSLELDLVSCQFCIHYSFESIAQARCMLKNAAECLKPGGFFVGTVPDSNQIV